MDRIEREEVYRMAVACFGKPSQKLMAIEEMSELTKAICKDFRGKLNMENLVEEMADVLICCKQIMYAFGIPRRDVLVWQDRKLRRLALRLAEREAQNE